MAADPDFGKMPLSEQRKALTAHDPSFGQMGDEDISSFVSAHQATSEQRKPGYGLAGGTTATMQAAPKRFTLPWFKQQGINFADAATGALPAAGATVGGTLGGAAGSSVGPVGTAGGAVSGAGIGGMAGEAGKQLIRRLLGFESPQTSQQAGNEIGKQGLIQAGVELPAQALPFLAGPLQRAATSQYERALAPTTKINKAITQDITPELIQRGETGSLESLEKRAGQKIGQLNPQLNQAYQQAGQTPTSLGFLPGAKVSGAGTKVIQDLENLKQSYMPGGNVAQPQAVQAIEGVQNIVKQYGPDISPDHLRRLRQIFEEVPAQRGAYAGADLSTNYTLNAQQQAADSIRGILNKNPDIGSLNKEISFWLDVQRVTSQSGLRRTGQEGGLMRVLNPLAGLLAGAGGFAAHGTETGVAAGMVTALAGYAYQATRSPLWRTTSAVVKDRFAGALARGDVGEVTSLLARLGVASGSASAPQNLPLQQAPNRQ